MGEEGREDNRKVYRLVFSLNGLQLAGRRLSRFSVYFVRWTKKGSRFCFHWGSSFRA